jgi:hypothetical protein
VGIFLSSAIPLDPRRFSTKPDSKIQNVVLLWLAEGGSLATLREASCLSCERTLTEERLR